MAGYFSSLEDVLGFIAATPVDLLLLGSNPGPEAGSDYIGRAREAGFCGGVLVVTGGITDPERLALIDQGCSGIFLHSQSMAMLHQWIRAAATSPKRSPTENRPGSYRCREVRNAGSRKTYAAGNRRAPRRI